MDNETRRRLEYEEQFYGMSSRFFIDSFKNFLKEELNTTINVLVDNFKSKIIDQTHNVGKLNEGFNLMKKNLIEEYTKSLEDTFEEHKSEIENILNIPSNVLLKEDLLVRTAVNEDINKVKQEIEDLKGNFKALLYLKQKLLDELNDANSAIIFMRNFISDKKVDIKVLPVEEMCELSRLNKQTLDDL